MEIKFVSYTGKYPCLCSGILTLNIDGKDTTFGYSYGVKTDYDRFWDSGGSCGFTGDYSDTVVIPGPWEIREECLPDFLKEHADELIDIFNENVEYGCCGGCL